MKILDNSKSEKDIHMRHEHNGLERHILPHERKSIIYVEYDEQDWVLLKEIFGDEDTTAAAVTIIREAPPEIQILAVQLINIIKEVA